ncbi:MAG: hypothetical protein AVDCRST_MAG18-2684, partial [uncultured Thermomicrobiales bacterium]
WWSAPSPGCTATGAWRSATNAWSASIKPSSTSAAPSSASTHWSAMPGC